jgi:hypothetical protein
VVSSEKEAKVVSYQSMTGHCQCDFTCNACRFCITLHIIIFVSHDDDGGVGGGGGSCSNDDDDDNVDDKYTESCEQLRNTFH